MRNLIKLGLQEAKNPVAIITNHLDLGHSPVVLYANKEFIKLCSKPFSNIVDVPFNEVLNMQSSLPVYIDLISSLRKNKKWNGPLVVDKEQYIIQFFDIEAVDDLENNTIYYIVKGYNEDTLFEENNKQEQECLDNIIDLTLSKLDLLNGFSKNIKLNLWRIDLLGNIVYLNASSSAKYGFRENSNISEYLTRESLTSLSANLEKHSNDKEINKIRLQMKGDNGKSICCQYWPIYYNNIIIGFGGILKDKSHEKNIIKKLTLLRNQ